jgi:hypothetical protein
MKKTFCILALACAVLLFAAPAGAAGGVVPDKVAAALGIRFEKPAAGIQVGQKANATVLSSTKFTQHGVIAKDNDKVVVTLTGTNSITVLHVGSGKSAKFTFDKEGNLTRAR